MTETCITATLIRGKVYQYNFVPQDAKGMPDYTASKYYTFQRNVPLLVPEKVADEIEELVELETTRDGEEEIERPMFRINRDAPVRSREDGTTPKKVRMRLVSTDEVKKPKLRPPPKGLYGRKIG